MGLERFSCVGKSRVSSSSKHRARYGCLAAAALSVLSATLASAKPANLARPVNAPHAGVSANVGNALVVRVPPAGAAAQARGAGEPILKTVAPTTFGFVKTARGGASSAEMSSSAPKGVGDAMQRIVRNGSTFAIVSTPTVPA